MDTVVPGVGVQPIVDGDIMSSDGTTVLGGDDKSGVAIVSSVLRVFTSASSRIRRSRSCSRSARKRVSPAPGISTSRPSAGERGLVLDSDSPGFLFTRAPGANHHDVVVHGRAAHAGMAPEKGMSAIQVAAEAMAHAARPHRRRDHRESRHHPRRPAVNIVPNIVEIRGEARSHERTSSRLKPRTCAPASRTPPPATA